MDSKSYLISRMNIIWSLLKIKAEEVRIHRRRDEENKTKTVSANALDTRNVRIKASLIEDEPDH